MLSARAATATFSSGTYGPRAPSEAISRGTNLPRRDVSDAAQPVPFASTIVDDQPSYVSYIPQRSRTEATCSTVLAGCAFGALDTTSRATFNQITPMDRVESSSFTRSSAVVGTLVAAACVRLIWLAIGAYESAAPARDDLRASRHVIWRDPGDVARASTCVNGPGGPDGAPGSLPLHRRTSDRIAAVHLGQRRAAARRWRVKWGHEVRSENFAVRLVVGLRLLRRDHLLRRRRARSRGAARRCSAPAPASTTTAASATRGSSSTIRTSARCSRNTAGRGTTIRLSARRELHGLKIIVMLLSNWDTKDRRDVARGSNTAIFEHRVVAAGGARRTT